MDSYRPVLACAALALLLALPATPAVAQICVGDACTPLVLGNPMVSVTATDTLATEAEGTIAFLFEREDEFADVQTLTFYVAWSGTATNGVDYPTQSTEFTFPEGETELEVVINPILDQEVEVRETVIVTVRPDQVGTNYEPGTQASATAYIDDTQLSTISLTVPDSQAKEGTADKGQFVLSRSDPIANTQSVTLEVGGSGIQDTHYTSNPSLSTHVTFASGQRTRAFDISVPANALTRDLTVTLRVVPAPDSYTVNPSSSQGTVDLLDNNLPRVSITAVDATAAEGTPPNTGEFRIQREHATDAAVVKWTTSGSATRGTDYRLLRVTVVGSVTTTQEVVGETTLNAGQTRATIILEPIQDTTKEGSETAQLVLQPSDDLTPNPSPADRATVTIEDDDIPLVGVTASKTSAAEPNEAVTLEFRRTVASSAELAQTLEVGIDVTANGATFRFTPLTTTADVELSGFKRTGSTTSIVFPANQATVTASATVLDDLTAEGTESVTITLKPGTGTPPPHAVSSQAGSVTLNIVDNDLIDADGDGVPENRPTNPDNCPTIPNPDQLNTDGASDGGDACDSDDDNDGLSDADEANRGTNPKAADSDGDGRRDGDEVAAGTDPRNAFSPDYRPSASSMTVRLAGTGVQLNWTVPQGSLANRFLVFRASDPELVGTVNAKSGTTQAHSYSFIDSLFPGGTHRYYVQAMLPDQSGSAYNATRAVAGPSITATVCEAITTDTDGDGICDAAEDANRNGRVDAGETDPLNEDSDGDGLIDGEDPDPLTPATVTAGPRVSFSDEPIVWVGLLVALATLALLVVGIVLYNRRNAPAPAV